MTRYGYFLSCEEYGPGELVHLSAVRAYTDAGFDEVYIGQVGGECERFFEFYAGQVLPRLREG